MKYLFFFLILFIGCKSEKKTRPEIKSPGGYSFENPVKIKLGEDLDEISGIEYDKSLGAIIALNDEEGKLFKIYTDNRPPSTGFRFHKGGDYEDLSYDGKDWYALKSNGHISKIENPFTDSMRSKEFKFPLKGKFNFESMFHDPENKRLVLLCKDCGNTDGRVLGYSFNLEKSETDSIPNFNLDLSGLSPNPLRNNELLRPSAAAYHPFTGELYVMASVNSLLIIADRNGKAKEVFKLDKKLFKQPEGLCFSPEGDMFVSNEARNGMANILHFKYTKAPKL
ncbi:MAG: hypothetical protein ACRC2O_01980 [Chitinophagaceae bacterium]